MANYAKGCSNSMILATNIQRFSLHDGPGIRTTVFLKGCTLKCPWCSNPENINPHTESYTKEGKMGLYGKEYTEDEIFDEVMKDKNFYNKDGGVTFSGGEPLLQAKEIVSLLGRFKESGITTAVETCLFVPTSNLKIVLPLIDFFYVDFKILDKEPCREILNGNIDLFLANLNLLCGEKKIVVRVPVIAGYTDDAKNRKLIAKLIKEHVTSIVKVELIKEHNLSEAKYKSLGLPVPKFTGVSDLLMEQYRDEIAQAVEAIPIEVCKV